jgi:hypothetical protein
METHVAALPGRQVAAPVPELNLSSHDYGEGRSIALVMVTSDRTDEVEDEIKYAHI